MSLAFFAYVVNLRMTYHHKLIRDGETRNMIFKADILQHRFQAFWGDDQTDMALAENMLKAGFFSPLYTQGGIRLLDQKAAEGYKPAQLRLAELEASWDLEPYRKSER